MDNNASGKAEVAARVDRRAVLQSVLAFSAFIFSLPELRAGVPSAFERIRPQYFIFDSRFRDARAAARHASHRGIPLAGYSGDLTGLWYDRVRPACRRLPLVLSGVTPAEGLFVLETLVGDFRMRVVSRQPVESKVGASLLAWTVLPQSVAAAMSQADEPGDRSHREA